MVSKANSFHVRRAASRQSYPFVEDIKRKSFVAGANSTVKTAQSAVFVEEVAAGLEFVAPLMRFLCSALDLPF